MVQDKDVKDIRSTGRRRARRALYEAYEPYCCADCGVTTIEPPKDAPKWFDEIWPEEGRTLKAQLQADHETKDLNINDEAFLNWRCPRCHKLQDSKTGKGEATINTSALW